MEITIDLETCKIIANLKKWNQYAVFVSKLTGEAFRLTIPELVQALEKAARLPTPPAGPKLSDKRKEHPSVI